MYPTKIATLLLAVTLVTTSFVTAITIQRVQAATVTYSQVYLCGQGRVFLSGNWWYEYQYCQNEYISGQLYAEYENTYFYKWSGTQWIPWGWSGWTQIYVSPTVLWKVGQTTELIKTPTYKTDVVAAACTIVGDNDVAKTFQLSCHEQTQLPAGTNATNPQHTLLPIFGGPMIGWGSGATPPPS